MGEGGRGQQTYLREFSAGEGRTEAWRASGPVRFCGCGGSNGLGRLVGHVGGFQE